MVEYWVRILECGSGNLDSPPQAGLGGFRNDESRLESRSHSIGEESVASSQ